MVIDRDSGRVGIGTDRPRELLEVNGKVRAEDFMKPSSLRWKTNVQTIEGALEKIESLRDVSFELKADGKHDIGLIAEEVRKVLPEVVSLEENGKDATAVDYAGLVPVLIEAVKEQQIKLEQKDAQIVSQQEAFPALIEEKDAAIAALQDHNQHLESRMDVLEQAMGIEAERVQTGLFPFRASVMWMLAGGLGLLLVTPGVVLGYRRMRTEE
jgi:hypothetical protein